MYQTFERERKDGTRETVTNDPDVRVAVIRRIVQNKQYEVIDGQMLDLFSASHILTVYNNLSDKSKDKYKQMPTFKMAPLAFELLERCKA